MADINFPTYMTNISQLTNGNDFSIEPMNTSTGIYVEELASIKTYHTEWKLIANIDLKIYYEEYNYLHNIIDLATNTCNSVMFYFDKSFRDTQIDVFAPLCNVTIAQMKDMMEDLDYFHIKWFTNDQNLLTNRHKREGPVIPFIGDFMKVVYGTLNEEDARIYMENFEELKKKNMQQDTILKNQTSLINSVLNQIRNNTAFNNDVLKNIIIRLNDMSKQVAVYYRMHNIKYYLSEIMDQIFILINHFSIKQKLFLNALTTGQGNSNNPFIFPPKLFYNELNKIRDAIRSKRLLLPIELTESNLASFYQLSTVESCILNHNLFISFKLPLIDDNTYYLYKFTSMPYKMDRDIFAYIEPRYEFLALDTHKEKYFPVKRNNIENCIASKKNSFLCKQNFPIVSAANSGLCEIRLLRLESINNECNIKFLNLTSEIWLKLNQPNAYIFVYPNENYVDVICADSKHTVLLDNSGIFKIRPSCEIRTNKIQIRGFQTLTESSLSNIFSNIKLKFNIENITKNTFHFENDKFYWPKIEIDQFAIIENQKELDKLSFDMKKIQNLAENLKEDKIKYRNFTFIDFISNIGFSMPNFNSLFKFIGICIIVYVLFKLSLYTYKKCFSGRSNIEIIHNVSRPTTTFVPRNIAQRYLANTGNNGEGVLIDI